jgi:hypothetical protein
MFTCEQPVLFDPVVEHGLRLSMLKDPARRLHVRVEGLPGRAYQLAGDIPPVDRHGLFVCVRWTPCKVALFLGQTLAHQIHVPTH